MLLSRILGGVGRFCIGLGILTLLFVAYQLWGTGILTAQAQNGLEDDFEELLEEAALVETDALEAVTEEIAEPEPDSAEESEPAEVIAEVVDPEVAERAAKELELLSNLVWRPNGESMAQLIIPDINLEWTVVEGVGTEELRKGPGHYSGTPMPGMAGNSGIAGHRTTWGAPFNRIDELDPGDEITVRTAQGTFEYRVVEQESGKGHFIVSPDRVDVLDQDFTEHPNRLTLTACHPKFSARQRIIVVAELIDEPALTVPRPEDLADVEIALANESFGAGETNEAGEVGDGGGGADDSGLPGDPDLDVTEDDAAVAEGEDETTEPASDEPESAEDDDAAATAPSSDSNTESGSVQPLAVAFQGTAAADSFGSGLNGNTGEIFPAVLWGLAALAIFIAAAFAAARWRKWPSYSAAIVPFALVLFVCFVHIDRALPSY
ncbi:MAG: class E sortase [Acidimicrobiales bacterium]